MVNEELQRWFTIERNARNLVRQGSGREGSRRLIQLLVFPAFEDGMGYQIFETLDSRFECCQTRWLRRVDEKRWEKAEPNTTSPEAVGPTTKLISFDLPRDELQEFTHEFQSLLIPAMASDEGIMVDGVDYELFLGNGSYQDIHFRWWGHGPPEWRELIRITERLLTFLQTTAKESRRDTGSES
jgi:hypothetical protein